jgi:hypothetical protein
MTKKESPKALMEFMARYEDSMRVLAICVKAISKSARIIDANDTVEQWLAILKEQALKIDPNTADWQWQSVQGMARSLWIESRAQIAMSEEMFADEWLEMRKEGALRIDPDSAEVDFCYGLTRDPYGVDPDSHDPDLPEEAYGQRLYFARAPGSSVWISFCDLPKEVRDALQAKHCCELDCPL